MQLTKDFSLEALIKSDTATRKGINNTPNEEQINNLKKLCISVLQPLQDALGHKLTINSGFRSPELNKAIGGSGTSQHCKGMACDIESPKISNKELFAKILDLNVPFDQLIYEFGNWIHVSFNEGKNREQKLIAKIINGKTQYLPYTNPNSLT